MERLVIEEFVLFRTCDVVELQTLVICLSGVVHVAQYIKN